MLFLSSKKQADVEAFSSASKYLMSCLVVSQIYPSELELNEANSFDTEVPILDLGLSITNGKVASKIYDKWDKYS